VIVAVVIAVTLVVVNGMDPDQKSWGTAIVGGTTTAGELLERLTTAPPAGAGPCRFTDRPTREPPLTAGGEAEIDVIVAGATVNWAVVETPLSVAVTVTGVGTETSASVIGISPQANPGIETVAGTGATAGFELVREMVPPTVGAAAVSCSAIR
jgi:hypothetical protein